MAGSYTGPPSHRLRGRENELRLLADALGEARARRGACLLLSGGPGRGKTTLLEHTRAMAGDFTVLYAGGVPDESDLAFAGLQRLLRQVEPVADRMAEDRRDLLRRTLGGGTVADADRFAFYTGVLELLTLAAQEQPLLLCVDDTDRLDGPSLDSLAFVARRLTGTPVAAVFAAHGGHDKPTGARLPSSVDEPTPDALIPGVTEHIVEPLPERAIHDVITDHAPVTVGSAVRGALVAAAHGNPAAVLGYLRCLTDAQLLGNDPLPETLRLDGRLRADLLTPYTELAEPTRHLLLLAALSREPRAHVMLAAAGGQDPAPTIADLEPAEERGLVRVDGDAIVFTDPLLREAIAQGSAAGRLRAAHRELAAVMDAEHAPVDFALHTSSGTGSPDAGLAAAVAEAALHAKRLEGSLAASLTHERAAGLTPESDERACRLTSAAYESYVAGRSDRAARLLGRARPLAVSDRRRATVDLIDAQLYMRGGNAIDAADRLLAAGRDLLPHDHALALRAFVRAADSASLAGDPVRFGRITDLALPLVRPDSSPSTRLIGAYLEGCAVSFRGDYVRSTPLLRSVNALAAEIDKPSELIWAGVTGLRLGDAPYVRSVTSRAVEVARVRVETANVPAALGFLVFSEFWSGRFPSAAGTALTGLRVARECGQSVWATQHLASLAMIAAIQGDVETCRIRAKAVAAQAGENSLGLASALAAWAQAVLELSRGNAADAFFRLRALAHAGPGHGHPTMRLLTAPHFVEAATRMGETDWAHTSLAGYRRWAEAVDSPGVLALAARCSGLLACGDEAADHFENALALHRACGDDDVEHARTQLLFGAFLRRARLPGRAREHLYNALESFERFGARLWVRQTRAELRAIGTSERGPDPSATSELTAQQQQIARLVAEGATNREVAAHMFISPRTVEHHLRGIFRKLNIRSRVDLARLFN